MTRTPDTTRTRIARHACLASCLLALPLAAQAPPRSELFDPATMARTDDLKPGMQGVGKTVFQGTHVEEFAVTVLAVLESEEFGSDMVLIRIDSGPCVDRGLGVVGGMSGSPIYVGGKLIGALAYGWSFSKEPIAGVQPIEQMLECIVPRRDAMETPQLAWRPRGGDLTVAGRRIDRVTVCQKSTDGPVPGAGLGVLTPVTTPLMVSGLGARARKQLGELLEPHGVVPVAAPGPGRSTAEFSLEPGAAVGVQLVRGDWEMTALGTLTCVLGERAFAFGHPFMGSGKVDMPLVSAEVHGVLPNQEMSFKFGSTIAPLGAVTEDRPWAVGGKLGRMADMLPAGVSVADLDRQVRRHYSVELIRHRSYTPTLSAIVAGNALDLLVPLDSQRTTYADFKAKVEGLPPLHRRNVFSSMPGGGGSFGLLSLLSFYGAGPTDAPAELLSLAYDSRFGEHRVEGIQLSLSVSEERHAAEIKRVAASKLVAKPGETVDLTVTLESAEREQETVVLPIRLPDNLPARPVRLVVCGGEGFASIRHRYGLGEPLPASFEQLLGQWESERPNNLLLAALSLPTSGLLVEGFRLPTLPVSVLEVLHKSCPGEVGFARDGLEASVATEWAIKGRKYLTLRIETDEREKAGRAYVSSRYGSQSAAYDDDDDDYDYGEPNRYLGPARPGAARRAWLPPWYELDQFLIEFPEEKIEVDSPPRMPTMEELESTELDLPESVSGATRRSKTGLARGPLIWVTDSEKDFSKGRNVSTQIGSPGLVSPGPEVARLPKIADSCYWAATTNAKGDLFVGTWPEGKVWRLAEGKQPEVVLDTKEPAVTCLTRGAGDTVWAAAAPSGTIYRFDGTGSKEFSRVPSPYVWGLCELDDGSLLAATGPEGKLYRIGADGKSQLQSTFPDRHLVALVRSKAGVFCATSPKGKVYRLNGDGQPESLFEAPKTTVQSLAADDAGNVFIGTSPRAYVYRVTPNGGATELYASRSRHVFSLVPDGEGGVFAALGVKGAVMHLTEDGQQWRLTDTPSIDYLGLAAGGAGELLATTVGGGLQRLSLGSASDAIYESEVRDAGVKARWGKIRWHGDTPGQSRVLLQTRTGNTAYPDDTWSAWSAQYSADFGQQIESPAARYIQYRAAFLADGEDQPTLDRVEVFALTQNRPPKVDLKSPYPGEVLSGKARLRWAASDPDRDKLTFTVSYQKVGEEAWTEIKKPAKKKSGGRDLDDQVDGAADVPVEPAQPTKEPATEQAANEGPLPGAEGRSEEGGREPDEGLPGEKGDEPGPGNRKPPAREEELPADEGEEEEDDWYEDDKWSPTPRTGSPQSREWDTKELAEGSYRVKVVASDEERNPGEGATGEAISALFIVDNSAPTLELPELGKARPDKPLLVKAHDDWSYLTSAEYRIDDGDWIAAAAADRVFDSRVEQIELNPAKLTGGKHKLEVRARDVAGNLATAEVEYEWPQDPAEQAYLWRSVTGAIACRFASWFTRTG